MGDGRGADGMFSRSESVGGWTGTKVVRPEKQKISFPSSMIDTGRLGVEFCLLSVTGSAAALM